MKLFRKKEKQIRAKVGFQKAKLQTGKFSNNIKKKLHSVIDFGSIEDGVTEINSQEKIAIKRFHSGVDELFEQITKY